jgi:hypothetical protein
MGIYIPGREGEGGARLSPPGGCSLVVVACAGKPRILVLPQVRRGFLHSSTCETTQIESQANQG